MNDVRNGDTKSSRSVFLMRPLAFYLCSVLLVFLCYYPSTLMDGLPVLDEGRIFLRRTNYWLTWQWDTPVTIYIGRFIGAFFGNFHLLFLNEIGDLSTHRFINIFILSGIVVISTLLFQASGIDRIPSALLAILIGLLPGFQQGVLWVNGLPFLLIPYLFSAISGLMIAYASNASPALRVAKILLALIFQLAATFSYQPAAMFLLLPMAVHILAADRVTNLNKTYLLHLGAVVAISLVSYFIVQRYFIAPYMEAMYPSFRGGAGGQIYVFRGFWELDQNLLETVISRMNMHYRMISASTTLWFADMTALTPSNGTLILFALLCVGLATTVLREGWRGGSFHIMKLFSIFLLLLAANTPNLAAAFPSNQLRTWHVVTCIILVMFVFEIFTITKNIGGKHLSPLAALILLAFSIAGAQYNTTKAQHWAALQFQFLRAKFLEIGEKKIDEVHLIHASSEFPNVSATPSARQFAIDAIDWGTVTLAMASAGYKHGATFVVFSHAPRTKIEEGPNRIIIDISHLRQNPADTLAKYRTLAKSRQDSTW